MISVVRATEHTGAHEKARSKVMPWWAKASMLGAGAPWRSRVMGNIHALSRLAGAAPGLTNLANRFPPTRAVLNATLVVSSAATLWRGMLGNPIAGQLFRQCSPDELAAVEASVLEKCRTLAGGSDRPLLLDASCHVLVASKRLM